MLTRDAGYYYYTNSQSSNAIVNTVATKFTNAGLNQLTVSGGTTDDGYFTIPAKLNSFNYYFYGTDYGTNTIGANTSLYWGTNAYLTFGSGSTTYNNFLATTNNGIMMNYSDRVSTGFYCSNVIVSTNPTGYKIINFLYNFTNYNAGIGYELQYRLISPTIANGNQYLELRINIQSINSYNGPTQYSYNLTNKTSWQLTGTYSNFAGLSNTSCVLMSDKNGNNWTFTNNASVNIY